MDHNQRKRFRWIQLYNEIGNAGIVCLKCGISRPTLRKWLRRFKQDGLEGLKGDSKRPKRSPARKVFDEQEKLILGIRRKRKLGARRIQNELLRLHQLSLSLATIHKVLKKNDEKNLERRLANRKKVKRYSRPIPGDRVQMDVCKIGPGVYQYTAIDDCTRYRVLGLYARRTANNSLEFLDKLIEEMPFPIQRIQTDRGREFFAYKFQERLMEYSIKFRPIKPGSPHLNGKVERSQRTDLEEFYATIDFPCPDLEDRLQEWQHYYNWDRAHGVLGGKTPMDKYFELSHKTPFWDEIEYDPSKERIQEQNYKLDLRLRKVKGSV